jgi:hypothetical protein
MPRPWGLSHGNHRLYVVIAAKGKIRKFASRERLLLMAR